MKYYNYEQAFDLENGQSLPGITIAYHTYGRLNADRNNTVWVCHALTANSDAAHWWPGVVGTKDGIDPDKYFIVCANILGSCYGTTGPLSTDPRTGQPYYSTFPMITIRDMVKAHILLRKYLGIEKIHLLMGGSMGGYQALEWVIMERERIEKLFLIATSPSESAWGIAIHTAQRLAIEADGSWQEAGPEAGRKGLKAARAIGILTYRNYGIMVSKQTDPDPDKLDHFRASSYINYQGDKLVSRFSAYCYWLLTKAMDSHQLARGRVKAAVQVDAAQAAAGSPGGEQSVVGHPGGNIQPVGEHAGGLEGVLRTITQKTLIMGIGSDILCPLEEQRYMARNLPDATLIEIDSAYGHDGFMVEGGKIAIHLRAWMSR